MSKQELSEDMTSEEIAAYADTVVKEIEEERAGDIENEPSVVNNTSDDSAPTDDNSGSSDDDDSAATDENDDSGSSDGDDWLTDELKSEAETYGIDDSELADFSSAEELSRAFKLFDKAALKLGREKQPEQKQPDESESDSEAKPSPPKDDNESKDRFEIPLDKEEYDEEIVDTLNGMRDFYDNKISRLEEFYLESVAKAEDEQFDQYVDSLGHSEIFGKTGKETKAELSRRMELNEAVKAFEIGSNQLGKSVEVSKELVEKVSNMLFSKELTKKLLKAKTKKVTKQGNSRLGGSQTKPQPPSDDPRDAADRLYKELEGY